MKKEKVIEEIVTKYERIKHVLNTSKCDLHTPTDLGTVLAKHLNEANAWLDELVAKEWKEASRARHCVSEAMWESYDQGGFCDELQEVILWKATSTAFRKKVRGQGRPLLFKKNQFKNILTKEAQNEANTKKG